MPITKLRFSNIGPFDDVEFEFDEQVNVFTGPNNSGKSVALMVLAEVLGKQLMPVKYYRIGQSGLVRWWSDTDTTEGSYRDWNRPSEDSFENLGSHDSGWVRSLFRCFIPALRISTDYRSRGPGSPSASDGHAPQVQGMSDDSVKQEIVNLDYRALREKDQNLHELIQRIGTMASRITQGYPMDFLKVHEEKRGMVPMFRTVHGAMPMDSLSQGTQSLIQWLARLLIDYAKHSKFSSDFAEKPGFLIVDEIDAHLHPSWQRRIIPTLTEAFPRLQVFCATHSPLMLAGLKEGQVQLLKRDAQGKVTVSRNETDIIGWSADEIMRVFLDVESPTDLATTNALERMQELRQKATRSPEEESQLRELEDRVDENLMKGPLAAQMDRFEAMLQKYRLAPRSRTASSKPTMPRTGPRKKVGKVTTTKRLK